MNDQEVLGLFGNTLEQMNGMYLMQQQRPLLAHYTSISVLESIMREEELWFSNPLFMNDMEEVRFGFVRGRQVIEQHQGLAALLGTRHQVFINHFIQMWNAFDQLHALDVYAFCLSEHQLGDTSGRLSMWRGYGGQGNGAALVFNTTHFNATPNSSLYVGKVSYGTQEERVNRFESTVTDLCHTLQGHHFSDEQLQALARGFFLVMQFYSLVTKDKGL